MGAIGRGMVSRKGRRRGCPSGLNGHPHQEGNCPAVLTRRATAAPNPVLTRRARGSADQCEDGWGKCEGVGAGLASLNQNTNPIREPIHPPTPPAHPTPDIFPKPERTKLIDCHWMPANSMTTLRIAHPPPPSATRSSSSPSSPSSTASSFL